MANEHGALFTNEFLRNLQSLVATHHSAYPHDPPRDIFFESLVQRAFRQSGWQDAQVVPTTRNSPQHDLLVGTRRISLKTETGKGTKSHLITITKLCTTEKGLWDEPTLIGHALAHLSRYDHILMLRAVWVDRVGIHYQLLEIPIPLLRLIERVQTAPVGKRAGRQSIAGDALQGGEKVFRVFFDGSDGKCAIRDLLVERCHMLLEWDHRIADI